MTRAEALDAVRWFAACGDRYVEAYLGRVDAQRLTADRAYALKLFLFVWAFERNGAPRSYRIAAVKAISSLESSQRELPALFKSFCHGALNPKLNPIIDRSIVQLDMPEVVRLAAAGAVRDAFAKLALRGVGPKLRAFFLRDLVTLFKAERMLDSDHDAYLWCQPIDVWVRFAAKELCPTVTGRSARASSAKYPLKGTDLAAARGIVDLSIQAGVSPLRVNQGIWYFSANAVADMRRLGNLIRSGDPRMLTAELALMDGFLPVRPMWG